MNLFHFFAIYVTQKQISGWFIFKLQFIVQFTIGNVGEAFRLPAVKRYECAGKWGEFVTVHCRDYNGISKRSDKLKFVTFPTFYAAVRNIPRA